MALLLTLLPILAQIGPYSPAATGTAPVVPHIEGRDTPRQKTPSLAAPLPPPRVDSKGQSCLDLANTAPSEAIAMASEWVTTARGDDLAEAQSCLGMAYGRRDEWSDAETAFLAARDASGADRTARASYGAMAGNAALAGGHADRALNALTNARTDAEAMHDTAGAAQIALDQARALVALHREGEARTAIDQALATLPGESDGWLLSATLYRRGGKLDLAQQHIEKASAINPRDPAIGLEAGVIAELGGREPAARRSWQSVIAMAPDSSEATQAKNYLQQIGPEAQPPAKSHP